VTAEIEHIGKAIKQARQAKGLSQRALARSSGIPQSHISKVETVGVDLTLSSLLALSRALDLEPMLVPRKLIPAVGSLIRTTMQGSRYPGATPGPKGKPATASVRPAYTLDEDEDEDHG
jgi:predicted XRE-type DNA-binding protein